MTTKTVVRYICPGCKTVVYKNENYSWICSRCKIPVEGKVIEYSNVFNIEKFAKQEYPEFRLSKPTVALLDDMIQTVALVQLDRCAQRATKKENPNRTLLPAHFDWNLVEEFKEFLEWKRQSMYYQPEKEEDED